MSQNVMFSAWFVPGNAFKKYYYLIDAKFLKCQFAVNQRKAVKENY